MKRLSPGQLRAIAFAALILVVIVAVMVYDPVMDLIFTDRDGMNHLDS